MNRQKVSQMQALMIFITVSTAAVFHPVFRNFLLWSGNAAWLPILAATGFAVVLISISLKLASKFPDQSLAEYAPKLVGPIIGYPLVLIFIGTFFLKGAFAMRNISEFFVSAILPETPISAVLFVMMVLVAVALFAELEGILRLNQLALPLILLALILVFVGSIYRFSAWNLLPLFNRGYNGLINSGLTVSSYLGGSVFLLLVYPKINHKQGLVRRAQMAIAFSGLIILGLYLNIVLFMSASLAQNFTWPYLAVTENIRFGLERGEALFMVIWIFAAFIKVSFYIYLFALGLSQLIPKLNLQYVGLASLPVVAYLSLMPDNLPTAQISHELLHQASVFIEAGVPILLLGVAMLKIKLRGNRHERT